MQTNVHEMADGIYRLSTCVPEVAPGGFTFNQFLVIADDPLLFHTGPRRMFPLVSQAIARIIPLARLRWIAFGHVESDECGTTFSPPRLVPRWHMAQSDTRSSFQESCRTNLDCGNVSYRTYFCRTGCLPSWPHRPRRCQSDLPQMPADRPERPVAVRSMSETATRNYLPLSR
jgi:hypothetical protein